MAFTRLVRLSCQPRLFLSSNLLRNRAVWSPIRFNSTDSSGPKDKHRDISLTAQVYPIDKDNISEQDVDNWLESVRKLKAGRGAAETETEIYLSELTNPEPYLEEKFEPTEEQKAHAEALKAKDLPLPFNPTLENFMNLIMRDGRKSKARKILSRAMYIVYLKTRKDPVAYVEDTLDRLGPLMATKVEKTGVAKNRIVPYPLNKRQRIRYAVVWILQGAEKKKSPDYSVRLAEEIMAAYEGKSSGFDRKAQMHKSAMAHRAYIRL